MTALTMSGIHGLLTVGLPLLLLLGGMLRYLIPGCFSLPNRQT
ncbi:MAG: hypothetical protein ACP5MM_04575 [Acidithiobacillus sp.]